MITPSLDVGDFLKVWDLRSNTEIACLNQKAKHEGLKDLQLLCSERMLGIRHNQGLCFWELNSASMIKDLDFSLENSTVFVVNDKQRVLVSNDKQEICELTLPNLNVKKRVKLPEHVHKIFYLPNGDVVLYLQREVQQKKNLKKRLAQQLKQKLFSKRKRRGNESEDEDAQESETESEIRHELVFMHWRSQIDKNMQTPRASDLSTRSWSPELPLLFEYHLPITSFRVVSNLNANSSTVQTPREAFGFNSDIFSENNPNMENNTIHMYVGTGNQKCFLLNVEISQFGEIYDKQLKEQFKELGVSSEQTETNQEDNLAKKMLMHIDSVVSERDLAFEDSQTPHEGNLDDQEMVFNDDPQAIHDYGYLYDADVSFRVLCQSERLTDNLVCAVSGKYGTHQMAPCFIPLGLAEAFNENRLFKLQLMTNLSRKKNLGKFSAFIFSDVGIALLEFSINSKKISCTKFLRKEIDLEVGLCYSESKDAFYMSNGKNIQVWDKTLSHALYNIDTSDHIYKIILLEKHNVLAVYDSEHYKEISTENLECLNREEAEATSTFFLNNSLIESGLTIRTSRFIDTFRLCVLLFCEPLSLTSFPFVPLQSGFRDEDFENPILKFAEYYFHRLKQSEHVDEIYGPLNPMILSIYHNDTKLLETLLSRYFYPCSFRGYWSPLEYAFRQGYQSAIKVICDCLVKRDHPVHFSKQDFHFLLESSVSYCHKLVATIPALCRVKTLPRLVYMDSSVELLYCNNISHLLTKIRKIEKVACN